MNCEKNTDIEQKKNDYHFEAFKLKSTQLDYFMVKLQEKLGMSLITQNIYSLMLRNHKYSHKFKQVYNPKKLKSYDAEPFQLNVTKSMLADTYGFSVASVYRAFAELERLQLITKDYLEDKHIKKYFINPERAWEFYNSFVREDTALAIWKKGITPKIVDTPYKLSKTRAFKVKYLRELEVKSVVEEKFVRVGRKKKVEIVEPKEEFNIPFIVEK